MRFTWSPAAELYVYSVRHDGSQFYGIHWDEPNDDYYLATSPDGRDWTLNALPALPSEFYSSVAYSGSMYVVVSSASGTNARIYSSPDGVTWTQRTAPGITAGQSVGAVAWNGTAFCAVSDVNDYVIASPDGITWTQGTIPSGGSLDTGHIAAGGGRFVVTVRTDAGKEGGYWSIDGLNWTKGAPAFDGGQETYVNGYFFSGRTNFGANMRSGDGGATWSSLSGGMYTYYGGEGLLFGMADTAAPYALQQSPDNGASWQPIDNLPYGSAFFDSVVTVGGETFVFTDAGVYVGATNESAWSRGLFDEGVYVYQLIYGGGRFVAVGEKNGASWVAVSVDGRTWAEGTPPADGAAAMGNIVYGNGVYVAAITGADTNTRFYTSTDGLTWADTGAVQDLISSDIAWNGQVFCAMALGGGNDVYPFVSSDGVTWQLAAQFWDSAETHKPTSTVFSNGVGTFIATSSGGSAVYWTSTDGHVWTERAFPSADWWDAITYGNGRWVALSYGGAATALYSTDAINWTQVALPSVGTDYYVPWVAWSGRRFVAVIDNATDICIESDDGITWVEGDPLADALGWWRVAASPTTFVAVPYDSFAFNYKSATSGVFWTGFINCEEV